MNRQIPQTNMKSKSKPKPIMRSKLVPKPHLI